MGRLKIAWISDFPVEKLPGVDEKVATLARYSASWQQVLIDELKHDSSLDVHIVSLRKELKENLSFAWEGVTFHLRKIPAGVRAPSLFWVDSLLLRPILRQIRPQIVHAWGTERGAAMVAHRLGYPYVVTIQGLITWYREEIPLNRYERFAAWLEDRSLPKAPLVTTESTFAMKFLEKRFPGLRVRQAEHAANWIFHRVVRRPQTKPLRIIFVGLFGFRKGADVLIQSLDRLQQEFPLQCQVIGSAEPEFLRDLKSRTSKGIWDRVEFRTNLTPEEVAAEMAAATLMVFPTRADTSPNAVKEAVVAGVPVVGTTVGGIPDYVFPGQNGVLFTSNSVEACVEAIRAASQHPLFREGKVDPATLAKVRDYLSPKRMAENFVAAYREVLG